MTKMTKIDKKINKKEKIHYLYETYVKSTESKKQKLYSLIDTLTDLMTDESSAELYIPKILNVMKEINSTDGELLKLMEIIYKNEDDDIDYENFDNDLGDDFKSDQQKDFASVTENLNFDIQ